MREALIAVSRLLPSERVDEPLDLWDHGEQGLAVEMVADLLADEHTPVPAADRTTLTALGERWGVAERVSRGLRWCPDPDDEDWPWRVVEGTDFGRAVEAELAVEIGPGHPLHGCDLTAWLSCVACDDILVRVHGTPYRCAIVHVTWSRKPEPVPWPISTVHTDSLDALDRLGC